MQLIHRMIMTLGRIRQKAEGPELMWEFVEITKKNPDGNSLISDSSSELHNKKQDC
jgi:hypothetical protein